VEGYRKLSVNNQMQLLQYVDMTPVAVGICGTDKSFMFCKYYLNVLLCLSVRIVQCLLIGELYHPLPYRYAVSIFGSSYSCD
jgi:hypothetical protein